MPPEFALDLDEPQTVMGETFGPGVSKCASRPDEMTTFGFYEPTGDADELLISARRKPIIG